MALDLIFSVGCPVSFRQFRTQMLGEKDHILFSTTGHPEEDSKFLHCRAPSISPEEQKYRKKFQGTQLIDVGVETIDDQLVKVKSCIKGRTRKHKEVKKSKNERNVGTIKQMFKDGKNRKKNKNGRIYLSDSAHLVKNDQFHLQQKASLSITIS